MTDRKAVPVAAGETISKIPPASGSLMSLLASRDPIATLESRIPEGHRVMLRQLGVRGSDGGVPPTRVQTRPVVDVEPLPIRVGDECVTVGGKRVVVLRCSVGRDADGTPIHRVVRKKTGDVLRISEKKLRR